MGEKENKNELYKSNFYKIKTTDLNFFCTTEKINFNFFEKTEILKNTTQIVKFKHWKLNYLKPKSAQLE